MKPWFKHYNVAHAKKTILDLQDKFGFYRGYAAYFLLVEYCHGIWNGTGEPVFNIPMKTICNVVGMYQSNVVSLLDEMQFHSNLKYTINGKQVHLHFHKLLEVQDKDAKRNRKRIANESQSTPLDKEEDKEEEKEKENIYSGVGAAAKEKGDFKSEAAEVLEYINTQHNRKFKVVDSNLRPIIAFLKAGFTQDNAADIVDIKAKDPFFKKNNRLFNPQTLFRKAHYGKYLEEAERCQK